MRLLLRHPSIGETRVDLDEGPKVFGRTGGSADVDMIWDRRVSRRHARFWVEQGLVWFEDLKSTNGTWVGRERVTGRQALRAGEAVIVGETLVALSAPGALTPEPSSGGFDAALASLISSVGEQTDEYGVLDSLAVDTLAPRLQVEDPGASFAARAAALAMDLAMPAIAPPTPEPIEEEPRTLRNTASLDIPIVEVEEPVTSRSFSGFVIEEPEEGPPTPIDAPVETPTPTPLPEEPSPEPAAPKRPVSSGPKAEPESNGAQLVDPTHVQLGLADREAFRKVYASELSRGGMFVASHRPPPRGAKLTVRVVTPDGAVELAAEVVHVVSGGAGSGAGLAFVDLGAELRGAMQRYADGADEHLGSGAAAAAGAPAGTEPIEPVLARAKELITLVEQHEIYKALGLPATASGAEVSGRLGELRKSFGGAESRASPPQRARLAAALKLLDKVGPLMSDPARRLEYDFRMGEVRVVERLAMAKAKSGPSAQELRDAWARACPEKAMEAAERAHAALEARRLRDLAGAIELAHLSLDLDPFQEELRQNLAAWEWMAKKQRA